MNDLELYDYLAKKKYSPEKRRQLAKEGKAMPDGSYPIVDAGDLENAIRAFGRGGGKPGLRAYITRRARALGKTSLIPPGWSSDVKKVETYSKPGTADVTPQDLKHLRPLLEYYRKQAHPFTSCKRDQLKHGLSPDHADRRCAVIKDLIEGNTHWRTGGHVAKQGAWRGRAKVVKSSGEWTPTVVEALDRVGDCIGIEDRGPQPTGVLKSLLAN